MLYGLYLSSAGMLVQRHQHEVIANNMANVNTTAFKRDVATFRTRAVESQVAPGGFRYRHPVLDHLGGGTFVSPTYTEFAQGEVEITNRPLDVCLKGPGFFTVADAQGRAFYTRDGRFALDGEGNLTTLDGEQKVLDSSGQVIQLDRTRMTSIGSDGTITQDGREVGRLEVVEFDNPNVLRKLGKNLFTNSGPEPVSKSAARVVAGALERSAADPVRELIGMIEAQRAYEANAQMISLQDQTLGRVVNDLARNI